MTTAAIEQVDGVVVEANGGTYLVSVTGSDGEERLVACALRAGLRWSSTQLRPGDAVAVDVLEGGQHGRITSKLPEVICAARQGQ